MNGTMVRYGSTDVEADRKKHHAKGTTPQTWRQKDDWYHGKVHFHRRGGQKMITRYT